MAISSDEMKQENIELTAPVNWPIQSIDDRANRNKLVDYIKQIQDDALGRRFIAQAGVNPDGSDNFLQITNWNENIQTAWRIFSDGFVKEVGFTVDSTGKLTMTDGLSVLIPDVYYSVQIKTN